MDDDWVLALEYSLATQFGWSLYDIDKTDMMSLIPFVYYAGYRAAEHRPQNQPEKQQPRRLAYVDEVNFL